MPKWHEACVCSSLWLVFKHYNLCGNKLIFLILEFTFNSIFVLGIFNNFVQSNILSKMKVSKSGPFSVNESLDHNMVALWCSAENSITIS